MTHGWNDGGGKKGEGIKPCEEHWVSHMARKINSFENNKRKLKKTATIGICWNSSWNFRKEKVESRLVSERDDGHTVGKICSVDKILPEIYIANACTTAKIGEYLGHILKSLKAVFGESIETHGIGR